MNIHRIKISSEYFDSVLHGLKKQNIERMIVIINQVTLY